MTQPTQIESYVKQTLTFQMRNGVDATHDVYTHAQSQNENEKVVVIIQELPGIGQETLSLADKFHAEGYTVVLPHLFGPIGTTSVIGNTLRVLCMKNAFKIFAKNQSSPIVDYLSQLCSHIKEENKVKGVAVIGMCLTGSFAISLMANDDVLAGFASQPSLPVFAQGDLHISREEVTEIKKGIDKKAPMHCGRFGKDMLCQGKQFKALDKTFNEDTHQRIIFHELPGKGHSILTLDFVDEEGHPTEKAFQEVLGYFDSQLA